MFARIENTGRTGMNWHEYTQSAWPDSDKMREPASTSHSINFLSIDDDTSRMPSGLQSHHKRRQSTATSLTR